MKNFRRAIHDSLHHWPAIVVATICSMGVATLWSANIGALFPVIEMTLKGDSMQNWLQKSIEASQVEFERLSSSLSKIEDNVADQVSSEPRASKQPALEKKQLEKALESQRASLQWKEWSLQLANSYLPRDPFQTICWIMGVLIISTLVKHLLMLANELLIGHVSTNIVRSLRMKIFEKSLTLDRKTYQSYGTSGLLATITYSAESLSMGLMNFFGAAIREPLRVISCLIGACFVCPRLLVLSLILAPLLIFVVTYFNRRVRSIATSILTRNAGFHEVILEALANISTVQAYTMENHERDRFEVCTQGMRRASMKMLFYTGLSKPFTELIGVGMIAITVCAGAYLIVNQQTHIFYVKICDEPLSVSSLLVFFGLLIGASDPLRKMSGVFTSIYTGAIAADSLYQLLDNNAALAEPTNPIAIAKPHHTLELRDVSFHYHSNNPVLKQVNLTIPFGNTVAIIGANGSGKSTLIQLLGRFYDPVGGQIMLNGVDFRQAAVADIRQRIALVSQTTELFNRSVMENIRYGSPESTEEEAIEAAKLAHAHEFIVNSLSEGYATKVGQAGQRLSGGQKQRIALARAILRKPEILILDESTSQIDMASELQIRESLQEMKGKFTIIIIAHREALIALADETYEVQDGHLMQRVYSMQGAA
jgi:ATP-binding cassette subfamily B protein/subfamily B ATP-binding cassette protein MsbA